MTTDLTVRRGPRGTLTALCPKQPKLAMTDAMYWTYDRTEKPHRDVGAPKPSPAVQAEAQAMLQELRPFGDSVPEQVVILWLDPLYHSVRNVPKTDAEKAGWLHGVKLALKDLAVGAFTEQTQQDALQTFTLFPAPAELYKLLSEPSFEIRQKLRVLNRIASTE